MESLRILIADDESIRLLSLRAQLAALGHLVVAEASNGEEAVALAASTQPDLAIIDIQMPVLDGIEAAAADHARHGRSRSSCSLPTARPSWSSGPRRPISPLT